VGLDFWDNEWVLILAATPIGNIGDASTRLKSTLEQAKVIAAEDTRTLLKLANHLGIKLNAELISLHEHNELQKLDRLVEIAQTADLVLVSDAGMPTISDPGFALVRACSEAQIEIQVVPGPSAVISALAVSGLSTDRFCFEGFLPRKSGERTKIFTSLLDEQRTMVFFESPHRIAESLQDAAKVFGPERKASVSRELTKKFEETRRGTLSELVEWSKDQKGEMVLVIAGAEARIWDMDELVSEVLSLKASGTGLKQASGSVAKQHGVSSSELYALALKHL
jgi:16S rRNA (cytidine1402-2'-O)-methyltransferase